MTKVRCLAAMVVSLLGAPAAMAHHSFAMFDHTKEVQLKDAVVVQWQWTNPHAWLMIDVPNGTPMPDHYSIECANPAQLRRQGFAINSFHPGDKVTVFMQPLLNGSKGGAMTLAVLADGKTAGEHLMKPVQ